MATKFATPEAIKSETPTWAKWMFRITFAITTALTGYIAATNLFSPETKYEATLVLKLVIDPVVFAVSKLFGVDPKDEQ